MHRLETALTARLRVPAFVIWEAVIFVFNVCAFTLISLQLDPIREAIAHLTIRPQRQRRMCW